MNAPEKNTRFASGNSVYPQETLPKRASYFVRRRTLMLLGVGLLVAFALTLWPGTKTQPPGGRDANTQPVPVSVASVRQADIRVTLNALGTVTPLATVIVK